MTPHPQPVALIAGASSGIGKATASLLAANGFRVFGTHRTPRADPPPAYVLLPLDVRSDASVQAAVQAVLEQAGRLDLLVNNAGYAQVGAIEETVLTETQAQFDTNLFGMLRVIQAVLPIMRRQRSGRLINVSSVVGRVALPYQGVYASSKFALEGVTEALRAELRPFQIHVSLVEPGFVKTNLVARPPAHLLADYETRRRLGLDFIRQGVEHGIDPGRVAQSILRVATAAHPRLNYPVGREAHLLITLKRLLPEPAFEQVRRRLFRAEALRVG